MRDLIAVVSYAYEVGTSDGPREHIMFWSREWLCIALTDEQGESGVPTFLKRMPDEVPLPSRAPRAIRERNRLYEGFIRDIGDDVGELELDALDSVGSVKVRLRRAATRLGSQLQIWDAEGKVYFRRATARRGGRRK